MFTNSRYVEAVYKEKSFSRAAEKLHISQPSLSATIRHIEEQVGYPLFDRSTKPIGITDCGEKYIETAEKIHALMDEYIQYVTDTKELKIGRLSLGGTNLFSSFVLPPMIQKFKDKYPAVEVSLMESDTTTLAELVRQGSVDIIIGNSIHDPSDLILTPLRREYLLLVVPSHFSINENLKEYQISHNQIVDGSFISVNVPAVPLQFFLKEPFVIQRPGTSIRRITDRIFARYRMRPNIAYELDQMLTAYFVCCSGLGMSLISNTLLSCAPPTDKVVCYKIAPEYSVRDIYFYYKSGRYVTKAMTEFLAMAVQPS